jgi:5'(3')-deoxyribonucleotidase
MKTIAWDVDDVLNDLMKEWLEKFWRVRHAENTLQYEDVKINPPHPLLGVKKEEYLASLDDFRISGHYKLLKPRKEVLDWFVEHGEKCRHVALTRVPVAAAHISAEWVMEKFGTWVRSFHFIPSYRTGEHPPVYDENKGAYLNYFGKADLLIDDTMENIDAARKAGVKTLVFPRPWNASKMTVGQLLNEVLKIIHD